LREITSLDSKLPDQTEVHIRSDILQRKLVRIQVALYLHCRAAAMLFKNINHKGRFLFTPMQNSTLIPSIEECFWVKGEDFTPRQTNLKGKQPLPILLLGPVRHLAKQWVTSVNR